MINTSAISPEHVTYLASQAIDIETAVAAGVRTVTAINDLPKDLRWVSDQLPGLLFIHTDHADNTIPQFRSDNPSEEMGKYLQPTGSGTVLSIHPGRRHLVGNAVKILIVEGTKQALAAASVAGPEVLVVGIQGCWGWSHDGLGLIGLASLAAEDSPADVYVAFDADIETNFRVYAAAKRLGEHMEVLGAKTVQFVHIPGSAKNGLDDYLASVPIGRRSGVLANLMDKSKALSGRPPAKPKPEKVARAAIAAEISWERAEISKPSLVPGMPPTRFAAFAARIIQSTSVEDDLNDPQNREKVVLHDIEVLTEPASEPYLVEGISDSFLDQVQKWLVRLPAVLGTTLDYQAGEAAQREIAQAIRAYAPDTRQVVKAFRRTGPATVNGVRCYLHAGGALTATGQETFARSELGAPLNHINFPNPAAMTQDERRKAARSVINGIGEFKDQKPATLILGQLAWVSSGAPIRNGVIVFGEQGSGKTVLTRWGSSFLSPEFAYTQMLGGDGSKGALGAAGEGLHHSTMFIDDAQHARSSDKAEGDAEDGVDTALRRSYDGGSAGRSRLAADPERKGKYVTIQADLSNIGVVVIGEHPPTNPGTDSGIARAISTKVKVRTLLATDDSEARLKEMSSAGLPQRAMAGLIQWMLGKGEAWMAGLGDRSLAVRKAVVKDQLSLTDRTAGIAANLVVGYELWMEYLAETLDEDLSELTARGRRVIVECAHFHATEVLKQRDSAADSILDRIKQTLVGESARWKIADESAGVESEGDLRIVIGKIQTVKDATGTSIDCVALLPSMIVKAIGPTALRRIDEGIITRELSPIVVRGADGRSTRSVRFDGRPVRALCIPLSLWQGGADEQADASAPTPENPAEAPSAPAAAPVPTLSSDDLKSDDMEEVDA